MCLAGCNSNSSPSAGAGAGAPVCDPTVHACPGCCAELSIQKLTFSGPGFHAVDKDTDGDFPTPHWDSSRADKDQSPVSYVRNTKLTLNAVFAVTTAACSVGESLDLKATATFGAVSMEWTGSVTVNPSDKTVSANLTGNVALPDAIGLFETTNIEWQSNACALGWKPAGKTHNVIYVTLGAPTAKNYWTLLDVSCRAAAGKTTADDLVELSFASFRAARGDGKGIKRKRDNQELSYWGKGIDSAQVFDCQAVLQASDGVGRCGSWADLLVTMHRLHGMNASSHFGVKPVVQDAIPSCNLMVQNVTFVGTGSHAAPFTHVAPTEITKGTGLPGIGKTNPQSTFVDHALVDYGGKIWDPSYGSGPFPDLLTWEKGAIAGLCAGSNVVIMQDGMRLLFSEFCGRGFIGYSAVAGDTLDSIATKFGIASGNALYNHPDNTAYRTAHPLPVTVKAGDVFIIPREISNIAIIKRK